MPDPTGTRLPAHPPAMPTRWGSGAMLALSLVLAFGVAAIGSAATLPAIPGWYAGLARPAWTPPNWLFGPVWALLYAMMAVAAWHLWHRIGLRRARRALVLYGLQLLANLAWSLLFFGLHWIVAAGIEILVLWGLVLLTSLAFAWLNRSSGWLMLPYLLWVGYAVTLNWGVVALAFPAAGTAP